MLIFNVVQEHHQLKYDDLIKLIESQDLKVLSKYAMDGVLHKISTKVGIDNQINNNNGNTALVVSLTMDGDKPFIQEHLFEITQVVV